MLYHCSKLLFSENHLDHDVPPPAPPDDADHDLSGFQSSPELETDLMWSQVSLSIEQAELRRLKRFEGSMLTQEQVIHYEELFSRGEWDIQDPDNLAWLMYKRASLAYHFELPPNTTFLRPEDTHVGNLLEIAEYQM